jgi:multisubunit Na+/H+ antiporter MnhF subunit
MTIQFWSNDPTVLFNKNYIFELWPTTNMCYEQKLNAITRLIIIITILGYISTMSKRILVVGICAIISIQTQRSFILDIGIAWIILSFIGTLTLAKYLSGKKLNE